MKLVVDKGIHIAIVGKLQGLLDDYDMLMIDLHSSSKPSDENFNDVHSFINHIKQQKSKIKEQIAMMWTRTSQRYVREEDPDQVRIIPSGIKGEI